MKKRLFLPLPGTTSDVNARYKLLVGLGKSTKRGIKKCYNCGIYNGTRSTMCKNKDCAVVLKDYEEKSKVDLDAVKLLTGTEKQVYSVRVRDMGPDYRGFVQLPVLQTHSEEDNILSEVALCFVDSCQNSFDNSILKCHEEDQNDNNLFCVHIKSAVKSRSIASPMRFKNDTLSSLNISDNIKEKLFHTATEKDGYFVQRVSKSVMAVKCQVSPKHPLGYLHFTFMKNKGKDLYEKWHCSCEEYSAMIRDNLNSLGQSCIHYYACLWALASDHKYYEEFNYFIRKETRSSENLSLKPVTSVRQEIPDPILSNTDSVSCDKPLEKSVQVAKIVSRDISRNKKPKKKEVIRKCQRIMPKILPIKIKILSDLSLNSCEESISWNFLEWLSFVTESINQTMQFENYGIVNTLTFQIPESFYNCLVKRIPNGYNVVQSDLSVTYHIMNILHLKTIFDTTQVKLKISKKFVHSDQGYIEYNENADNNTIYQSSFIFFLNVGESTVDESYSTNNYFVIEWILVPNFISKVGNLKLYYKYGRKST